MNDFREIRRLRKTLNNIPQESLKEMDEEQRSIVLQLRRLERKLTYKYDFWAFIIEVMDAENKTVDAVKLAPIHRRMCRHIRSTKNLGLNCMIRVPRYHLKTQICTIYYRLWRAMNDPELCAVIVSGTLELSKDTARSIKFELTNNAKLKIFWPEVVPDWIQNERRNKWSETQFNVARTGNHAQCTIEAYGVSATVTGKHFKEIQLDDIVTRENSETPEQCEKIIKAYKYFLSIGNPQREKGKIPIMIVGTNYTDNDLYAFLEQPEIKKGFRVLVQKVFDDDGELIWKELYNKEWAETTRNQQGSYIWSAQYLLDPVPESEMEFKREWIQIFRDIPKDINDEEIALEKLIVVDPITAKKTTSTSHDRGVVLCAGWDKRRNIYILDYKLYSRAKESELFDGVFGLSEKWGTKKVLWESVAYQAQGAINLEEKSAQYGRSLQVIQVRPGHRDKDVRIRTMIPHFERGQLYIRYWMDELISEIMRFPYGRTKDIVDAMAYALEYIMKKGARKVDASRWKSVQPQGARAWYL